MYPPFADAMNYALERLSTIKVDGLPEPKVPIVFVPCDKGVSSDRDSPGSSFKPDLAIMTLEDACKLYGLDKLDVTKVSEFVSKVPKVSSVAWKTILSVAEMKRKKNPSRWPTPGSQGPQDADRQPDGERDASQRTTRKIDTFPYEHTLMRVEQQFHRRPWYPPNGRRVPRGWMLTPGHQTPNGSGHRRTLSRTSHNHLPTKLAFTQRRSSPIRFRSATCLTCSSKVRTSMLTSGLTN